MVVGRDARSLIGAAGFLLIGCGNAGPDFNVGGGTATGGGSGAGGGGGAANNPGACEGAAFGVFSMTQCDGGVLSSTLTFFSDGGASVSASDTGACGVDRMDCEYLLTCGDSSSSQFSLEWVPAEARMSGSWERVGNQPACVQLQKQ